MQYVTLVTPAGMAAVWLLLVTAVAAGSARLGLLEPQVYY